ncbi:U3 small nucleolar RNA-associated protein 14 homolog A isoform X2 [Trichomycterus rosablanca]|uniref:U3 small nucleolar RNA-associated protein 14 homolog A isoform X2 n=1 Tax=Trichomycterus rosablanca TaxID=2290929 RepID=UPI002F35FC6B
MVKSGSTKRNQKSRKSKNVKMPLPVMDEDENDEELHTDEENIISASEDEEEDEDERKHIKLLEAISSLGAKRRKKHAERSEASVQVSEFSVNAEGAGDKVQLSDLLGSMEQTPGAPKKTKKQLKNLQNSKETLELPLSRQQTEKIQRGVAYERSSKEVSRWESVVIQNQKAEQLFFPLKQEPAGPKRVEQVVAGWKAQTPLEQQIFSLLQSNKQPINDPVLTPAEEASIQAMSLEEAKIRRAELQKARALQSYYEAKARRERKIKSKKYHKVQKKAKRKEFLKQFDEMMKTDPDAALEELKKMELSRMEERMSLKHQNSGKWAKTKAIMAKYDDSARKAMQEQLEVNKQLTQKVTLPSDDEEEEDEEDEGALPDFVNDAELGGDSVNPWMRGKLSSEVKRTAGQEVTPEPPTAEEEARVSQQDEEEDDEEEEENEEEQLLRQFERKRELRDDQDEDLVPVPQQDETEKEAVVEEVGEAPGDEDDEEEEKEEVVSEFNSLFNRLIKGSKAPAGPVKSRTEQPPVPDLVAAPAEEEEELLSEGLTRARTLEDLEALSRDEASEPDRPTPACTTRAPGEGATPGPPGKRKKKDIDPNEVLTKQAKVITVPLAPTLMEQEDEAETEEQGRAEQIAIIKEAFAGDDVISDFLKDKRNQEDAGKPKEVDLTLPGWGEWGGLGLKPSRYKRRKFRVKPPLAPVRKDEKLPAVIISEKRNSSVVQHQVNQLPFPFQNRAQFESCIRSPVGQTWNTQNTVKKLTAPKVVTRLGNIIEPMKKEDFLSQQKSAHAARKRGDIVLEESNQKRGARRAQRRKRKQKEKN